MSGLRITYSLADQSFAKTKSIGIFNLSLGLAREFQSRSEVEKLHILTNSTLQHLVRPADNTTTSNHDRGIQGQLGRMIWDQWKLYSTAKGTGTDWLFLPKGFASFIRKPPMRLATCVADTIHDYYRDRHPTAVSGLEDRYFDHSLRATIKYSDVIFTISEFTRSEVVRVATKLGMKPPPVIHAGIGFEEPAQPVSPGKSGIMVLAGRYPHKRTKEAIALLDRWQRDSAFTEAVNWIGSLPKGAIMPDRSNWKLHSRLSEEDYRQLVARSRVLLFTSEYEGYGMPPVEATLVGTVPVFSAIPATIEVMGQTGLPFDNENPGSFTKAMNAALQANPDDVSRWKTDLLARHSWRIVGDRILAGLRQAMTS